MNGSTAASGVVRGVGIFAPQGPDRFKLRECRHAGATPEDVDYKTGRCLDKPLFQQLLTGKWIRDRRNLMITGPCGVGKTWRACALAQAACRDGMTVLYGLCTFRIPI